VRGVQGGAPDFGPYSVLADLTAAGGGICQEKAPTWATELGHERPAIPGTSSRRVRARLSAIELRSGPCIVEMRPFQLGHSSVQLTAGEEALTFVYGTSAADLHLAIAPIAP
jgi:hypothetical protein